MARKLQNEYRGCKRNTLRGPQKLWRLHISLASIRFYPLDVLGTMSIASKQTTLARNSFEASSAWAAFYQKRPGAKLEHALALLS